MCLKCYVTYKEQLPIVYKLMSTSKYTIEIHDALCEEQWQRKNWETGTSGTKKMQELNPNTSENYLLNSICVCVFVTPFISFYGNGH